MYNVYNPTKACRVIYDANNREVILKPGQTVCDVNLAVQTVSRLRSLHRDLVVLDADHHRPLQQQQVVSSGHPMTFLTGMLGVGDNIHLRAVIRELKKTHDVKLESFQFSMYHDLIDEHLELIPFQNHRNRARIRETMSTIPTPKQWRAERRRITYDKRGIETHGSILAAQFACCGLKMPAKPDFSLPIPKAWGDQLIKLMANWPLTDKPIMVYRPIILNNVWNRSNRSPDPIAYEQLYKSIRDQFFVVSIANLKPGQEWIVGREQDVDIKLNHGELDFETMAALFSKADLIFGNAGFTPVLAQATGTPNITVYGGNESSRTTNRVGMHLAPSLFIEPDRPCDCHSAGHACDRRISVQPAIEKIKEFISVHIDFRNNICGYKRQGTNIKELGEISSS